MHIDREQSNQCLAASAVDIETEHVKTPSRRGGRSLSSSTSDKIATRDLMDRVKHTFDYKSRGCKGNTRGDFIHDTFITFEQLLTQLPPHIGMDIELSQSRTYSFSLYCQVR